MVIGNAGGGKSTLSRRLAAQMNLPHLAIDQIQWQPGWVKTPESDYDKAHAAWLAQDRWLIDGVGSWPSIQARLNAAEVIIFVDLPFWHHLWWAMKRQVTSLFVGRKDGPNNSPMWKVTFRLVAMMWWLHRHLRPDLIAAIDARRDHARVIVMTSKHGLDAPFS